MDHRLTVSVNGVDHKMVPVFNPETGEQGYTAEDYLDKDTSDLLVRSRDGNKIGYFGDGWTTEVPTVEPTEVTTVETKVAPSKTISEFKQAPQEPTETTLTQEEKNNNTLRFIASATAAGWSLAKIGQYLEGKKAKAAVLKKHTIERADIKGDYDERVDDLRKKYVLKKGPLVANTNKESKGYRHVRAKHVAPGAQPTRGQGTARRGTLHIKPNTSELNTGRGIDTKFEVVDEVDKANARFGKELKFDIKPKGKLGILSKVYKALGGGS